MNAMMTINKISGTILATVPMVLTSVACLMPRSTRKLKPQIRIEPPMMEARLLPPAKYGGKK